MASKKRDFQAFVPVAITVRFTLRLPLIAERALQQLMLSLMVRYAGKCGVDIYWYDLRSNHLHITVQQRLEGHDHMRREGISPWMRNVLSVFGKKANAYYSTQGHVVERTFRSHNLPTNEQLLANQAYTLGNKQHHTGESVETAPSGAFQVYAAGQADGVVNVVPAYLQRFGDDAPGSQLVVEIIERAIRLEQAGTRRAWLTASRQIIAERALPFPALELARSCEVVTLVDAQQQQVKVAERLAWDWTRIQFQPRRAPRLGELIEIVVRRELDPATPFG